MSETAASPSVDRLSTSRSSFFWACWSLLAVVLVGYIWNVKPVMSPNDGSRWDTIWSLVQYGTYEIFDTENFGDKQQFKTIDKVKRRHDGAMISSKPPLFPTVAAGVVEVAKLVLQKPFSKDQKVPGRPTIPGSIHVYAKIVLIVFNVIPMLVVVWLFRRWLERESYSEYAWLVALTTFAIGTLVTGYLVTLNNHVVAATAGFAAVYHLSRIWREGKREYWRFVLLGLLAGWTAANELPAGILVVGVLLVGFVLDWKRTLLGICPALALVTAAFFYTNYLAVGDPEQPTDYRNFVPAYIQKDLYKEDATGEPSYWARKDKSGIDALNDHPEPYYIYFANMTIGHHGLYSLSPILLFATAGWFLAIRDPSPSPARLGDPRRHRIAGRFFILPVRNRSAQLRWLLSRLALDGVAHAALDTLPSRLSRPFEWKLDLDAIGLGVPLYLRFDRI